MWVLHDKSQGIEVLGGLGDRIRNEARDGMLAKPSPQSSSPSPVAWLPLYGDLIQPRGCEFSFLLVSVVMGVVAADSQGQEE